MIQPAKVYQPAVTLVSSLIKAVKRNLAGGMGPERSIRIIEDIEKKIINILEVNKNEI